MFSNWKTSIAGLGIILGTVLPAVSKPSTLLDADSLTKLVAAIGLIVARDHNVTGGSKQQ